MMGNSWVYGVWVSGDFDLSCQGWCLRIFGAMGWGSRPDDVWQDGPQTSGNRF